MVKGAGKNFPPVSPPTSRNSVRGRRPDVAKKNKKSARGVSLRAGSLPIHWITVFIYNQARN